MSALTAFRVSIWLAPDAASLPAARSRCWAPGAAIARRRGAAQGCRLHADAPRRCHRLHGQERPGLAGAGAGAAHSHRLGAALVGAAPLGAVRGLRAAGAPHRPVVARGTRAPHGAERCARSSGTTSSGRFTRVAAPAALDYTRGHRISPASTCSSCRCTCCPGRCSWRRRCGARGNARVSRAPRHAVALRALRRVPFSAAVAGGHRARHLRGARHVRFRPAGGLWVHDCAASARASTAGAALQPLAGCAIAWALAGTLAIVAVAGAGPPVACAAAAAACSRRHSWLLRGARAQRAASQRSSAGRTPATPPHSSRGARGAAGHRSLAGSTVWRGASMRTPRARSLALLDPDETTIAILDRGFDTPFTLLSAARMRRRAAAAATRPRQRRRRVAGSAHGRDGARAGAAARPRAAANSRDWLERFHRSAPPGDGVAGRLVASGVAALVQRYELPQGRRYALLGPPP